ncbi:reverse transcriptase domain-containing protein [Tanacetum coccineum]
MWTPRYGLLGLFRFKESISGPVSRGPKRSNEVVPGTSPALREVERRRHVFKRARKVGEDVCPPTLSSYSRTPLKLTEASLRKLGYRRRALEVKIKERKLLGKRIDCSLANGICDEQQILSHQDPLLWTPKTWIAQAYQDIWTEAKIRRSLKIFQAAAKTERWVMPTWCHMFNSTLTGNARVWFDDLPPESIDSYDDLKKAFLENYLQQKKCIKDPIEIHNIKQREGESTEDFVKRYKLESRDGRGAPSNDKESSDSCMELQTLSSSSVSMKKSRKQLMRVTTSFLRGEVAASNHERKKMFPPWKQHEGSQKQNFKKGGFRNQQRVARQRITQSFSPNPEVFFPPLGEDEGTEGPMIIEAEIGGHCVHPCGYDCDTKTHWEHRLNGLQEAVLSVRQKKEVQAADRKPGNTRDVGETRRAGIIKDVH